MSSLSLWTLQSDLRLPAAYLQSVTLLFCFLISEMGMLVVCPQSMGVMTQ